MVYFYPLFRIGVKCTFSKIEGTSAKFFIDNVCNALKGLTLPRAFLNALLWPPYSLLLCHFLKSKIAFFTSLFVTGSTAYYTRVHECLIGFKLRVWRVCKYTNCWNRVFVKIWRCRIDSKVEFPECILFPWKVRFYYLLSESEKESLYIWLKVD